MAPKVYPRHAIALREIETLLRDRRRRRPIGDEELAIFLRIAAPRLAADECEMASLDQALAWARVMMPELGQDRARRILERYGSNSPYKARTAGDLLQVERDERNRLRLTKIRYAGQTDKRLADDRREKDRDYQKRKRAAAGATPRDQSLAARRPWEIEGISRAEWYRRRKAVETVSSAAKKASPSIQLRADEIVSRDVRRSEGSPQAIPDAPRAVMVIPSSAGPIAGQALRALAARSTFSVEVAA